MSDAQKIQTVMKNLAPILAEENKPVPIAAPVEDKKIEPAIKTDVASALGLDKPAAPIAPVIEKAGYVDTSKLAPKTAGYVPDTDNKKFFDFIQDRYRAGNLGVAPGYNFYSDSPKYNDKLVEEYKARYPEIAAQFATNQDPTKYEPTTGPKTENKHELAPFWDYAAGRQENNDLRDLYMYGFKSDDPNATPEIMQRLKDENPWLWDEYQKKLAEKPFEPEPGKEVPPSAEIPKPTGSQGKGNTATAESKKLPDIIGTLGKLGYSALEILQAGMAGGAGITDFNQTSAGRRVLKEAKDKEDLAKKSETAEERAFQEKLIGLQDANDTKRLMADQAFQKASQEAGWSQEEKMAVAQQARDLEKMGYDRATSLMLASQGVGVTGNKPNTDILGLKDQNLLDTLFSQGKITQEEYEKQKGAIAESNGVINNVPVQNTKSQSGFNDNPSNLPLVFQADMKADQEAAAKKQAETNALNSLKTAKVSNPAISGGSYTAPKTAPQYQSDVNTYKTKAEKQKYLLSQGFIEKNASAGMWEKQLGNGLPPVIIQGVY